MSSDGLKVGGDRGGRQAVRGGARVIGVIGVGLDIVAVERIQAVLCRHGERFMGRLLSEDELRAVIARGIDGTRLVEYLAGRFAAKEAVAKASGCGIAALGWRNIEILADRGAPVCRLAGRAAAVLAGRGIVAVQVSITHERGLAAACAVAIGDRGRAPAPEGVT